MSGYFQNFYDHDHAVEHLPPFLFPDARGSHLEWGGYSGATVASPGCWERNCADKYHCQPARAPSATRGSPRRSSPTSNSSGVAGAAE